MAHLECSLLLVVVSFCCVRVSLCIKTIYSNSLIQLVRFKLLVDTELHRQKLPTIFGVAIQLDYLKEEREKIYFQVREGTSITTNHRICYIIKKRLSPKNYQKFSKFNKFWAQAQIDIKCTFNEHI